MISSWLGFFVAFFSWFAFAPLIPESIKSDLKLTPEQIGNSNVVSLVSTLLVRLVVGPLVDRYGPCKVMASLLVLGGIPSGLAGTVTTANGLYVIRFFISILGGTFVTCQVWTTAFFDKGVVGRANALAAGWDNAGGGVTFIVMIALYNRLSADGLSKHVAWRVAFAIVPVPILLGTAALIMIFGTDHPAGSWTDRFEVPVLRRHQLPISKYLVRESSKGESEVWTESATRSDDSHVRFSEISEPRDIGLISFLDMAMNEPPTWGVVARVIRSPVTWLPTLGYLTTFGYSLAIDVNLATVLFSLFHSKNFGQTKASNFTAIFGMLNIFTRPLGGYVGDFVYRYRGVPGKKHLTIVCGVFQGLASIALGLYIDGSPNPSLVVIIVIIVFTAIFNEMGNGANFALVPHCNPSSGIVGAAGNVGGVLFAIIFRFQPAPAGTPFWISGALALAVNLLVLVIPVPAL